MSKPKVPLVDLRIQQERIAAEVQEGSDRVIGDTAFVLGFSVEELERAYVDYSGAAHCRAVGNGTDAIEIALRMDES